MVAFKDLFSNYSSTVMCLYFLFLHMPSDSSSLFFITTVKKLEPTIVRYDVFHTYFLLACVFYQSLVKNIWGDIPTNSFCIGT